MTEAWPALPLQDWHGTYAALHMRTQIVGKTRLALEPMQNHWWHVTLSLTSRGLTTGPMSYGGRTLDVDFDFVEHRVLARTSDGGAGAIELRARPVAEFYQEYLALLRSLGVEPRLWPVPVEVSDPVPFPEDVRAAPYDADAASRCWRALLQADRVLKAFRGRFLGKCSPVHFWWGAFDLACTRFSGRPAPPHPGGVPGLADFVAREAYSHECISAGWWPGSIGGPVAEPAFYAYVYPEPEGCATAPVGPRDAYWHATLHEWVLPYDAVRNAADPDAMLLVFLQSTYDAAARLAGWDRSGLDR